MAPEEIAADRRADPSGEGQTAKDPTTSRRRSSTAPSASPGAVVRARAVVVVGPERHGPGRVGRGRAPSGDAPRHGRTSRCRDGRWGSPEPARHSPVAVDPDDPTAGSDLPRSGRALRPFWVTCRRRVTPTGHPGTATFARDAVRPLTGHVHVQLDRDRAAPDRARRRLARARRRRATRTAPSRTCAGSSSGPSPPGLRGSDLLGDPLRSARGPR